MGAVRIRGRSRRRQQSRTPRRPAHPARPACAAAGGSRCLSAYVLADAIGAACELVAEHSGVGRARDEVFPGAYSWPVKPSLIFYRPDPRPVGIARILHGSRDLPVAYRDD